MGMGLVGRQEVSSGLNRRVNGLNGDLRGGQVAPHENVQVRNLGEGGGHGWCSRGQWLEDSTLAGHGCSRNKSPTRLLILGSGPVGRVRSSAGLRISVARVTPSQPKLTGCE
jgi:hypothetical protein